jgi:hypothetical protein
MNPDHATFTPGTTVTVLFERAGALHEVSVITSPDDTWTSTTDVLHSLMMLTSVAALIATILFALKQPGWPSILLFAASASLIDVPSVVHFWGRVLPFGTLTVLASTLLLVGYTWATWFLALFAIVFRQRSWSVTRATAAFIVGTIVALLVILPQRFLDWSVYISFGVALVIFAISYSKATPRDRRRLAWLMVAVTIDLGAGIASDIAFNAGYAVPSGPNMGVVYGLVTVNSLTWFGILYAVWRESVVDVRFAINKSLVAGMLTAILIGLVGITRWIAEHLLAHSGLTSALEVAVTVVFGFGLNVMYRRMEATIERFVFRQRYAAEQRLQQLIASVPFVTSRDRLDTALVEDVASDLHLTSSALFSSAEESYTCVRSMGWPENGVSTLNADDHIVHALLAGAKTIAVHDTLWEHPSIPTGEAAPAYVVPLRWQNELLGFIAYGRHRDGSLLDPEELDLVRTAVDAVTAAYATLEVTELRRRLAAWESGAHSAASSAQ